MVVNINRELAEETPRRSRRTIRKFSCYSEVKQERPRVRKERAIDSITPEIYSVANPRRSKRIINKFSSDPSFKESRGTADRSVTQSASHDTSNEGNSSSTYILKTKRTLPEIRKEMLSKGAFLFRFKRPQAGSTNSEHIKRFERIQQGGILVTTTGCMFPHETYFKWSSKERPFAYKSAAFFFLGLVPEYGKHRNGWCTRAEVSHRCHRKDCINPCHILYEPHWKNSKRNYCGDDETGCCNCGMEPKCVAEFRTSKWVYNDKYINYDTKNYKNRLQKILGEYKFEVLDRDIFSSKDTEALLKTNQRRYNKLTKISHFQTN